jgi:hypothetical protein
VQGSKRSSNAFDLLDAFSSYQPEKTLTHVNLSACKTKRMQCWRTGAATTTMCRAFQSVPVIDESHFES